MADMTKELPTVRMRAFVVMATLLALTACGQGPGDAARAAMDAAGRGQTAEALERVDPEIKATAGILIAPMLHDKAMKATKRGGVKSVAVEKIDQTDADHAVVTTVTHYGDGSVQADTGKVRRVEGKWYITM